MAVPTDDQLVIEKWTGSFDAKDHQGLYDSYGDGHLVALHILRARLATVLCGPALAGVDNDYSEDWAKTIKGLEELIEELENVAEALGLDIALGGRQTLTVGRMTLDEVRNR